MSQPLNDTTVATIAGGERASRAAKTLARRLQQFHAPLDMRIVTTQEQLGHVWGARAAKVALLHMLPNHKRYVVYMDADMWPYVGLDPLVDFLRRGWEMVICPSTMQGESAFHHLSNPLERDAMRRWPGVALQAGLFAVDTQSDAVQSLFLAWGAEWIRWRKEDQGALARVLESRPLRMLLLSTEYNSPNGKLITHQHGNARE